MQHEFKFTMAMFPGREFLIEAPSLIAAMMRTMAENGTHHAHSTLRDISLQIIADNEYKWLNKP